MEKATAVAATTTPPNLAKRNGAVNSSQIANGNIDNRGIKSSGTIGKNINKTKAAARHHNDSKTDWEQKTNWKKEEEWEMKRYQKTSAIDELKPLNQFCDWPKINQTEKCIIISDFCCYCCCWLLRQRRRCTRASQLNLIDLPMQCTKISRREKESEWERDYGTSDWIVNVDPAWVFVKLVVFQSWSGSIPWIHAYGCSLAHSLILSLSFSPRLLCCVCVYVLAHILLAHGLRFRHKTVVHRVQICGRKNENPPGVYRFRFLFWFLFFLIFFFVFRFHLLWISRRAITSSILAFNLFGNQRIKQSVYVCLLIYITRLWRQCIKRPTK